MHLVNRFSSNFHYLSYEQHKLMKMSKRCKSHGKLKYYETYMVQSALTNTQIKRGDKGAQRYYQCPDCGAYHLTSKKEEQIYYTLKHRNKWMKIFDKQIEERKEKIDEYKKNKEDKEDNSVIKWEKQRR